LLCKKYMYKIKLLHILVAHRLMLKLGIKIHVFFIEKNPLR